MKEIPIIPTGQFWVSDEDFERLKDLRFYKKNSKYRKYIYTDMANKTTSLYKLLFECNLHGKYVHHINGNELDFTRENLDIKNTSYLKHQNVKKRENCIYKGIVKTGRSSWKAIVYYDHSDRSFTAKSEIEAAIAYNVLSEMLFGEHANLNIVDIPDYDDMYKKIENLIKLPVSQRKSLKTHVAKNAKNKKGKTSKYKGICWSKSKDRWISRIKKDLKVYYLGSYKSEEEAALAYDEKSIEFYGEYAVTNFPK